MISESELPEGSTVLVRDENDDPEVFEVKGSKGNVYQVRRAMLEDPDTGEFAYRWICSCPAYEYGEGKPCKHMRALELE